MSKSNSAQSVPIGSTSKICRLCACKDGPFLNIFGNEINLAKKIEELLFIMVEEWDDLSHKICYRCSAKVSEFHEFMEKCIQTQEQFAIAQGKKNTSRRDRNNKTRRIWEAKLNKNKISNDEYCDELVKKALESVTAFRKSHFNKTPSASNISSQSHLNKVKIVLQRVDSLNFPGIVKREGQYFIVDTSKRKTRANPMSKHEGNSARRSISAVEVAGYGSIYTCNICKFIFVDKNKLTSHSCKKVVTAEPPKIPVSKHRELPRQSPRINKETTTSLHNISNEGNVSKDLDLDKLNIKTMITKRKSECIAKSNEVVVPPTTKLNVVSVPVLGVTADAGEIENLTPPVNTTPQQIKMQTDSKLIFPSNCYFAPMGDNSYILKLKTDINNTSEQEKSNTKQVSTQRNMEQKNKINNQHVTPSNLNSKINMDNLKTPIRSRKLSSKSLNGDVIDLDETSTSDAPYPIGLLFRNSKDKKHSKYRDEQKYDTQQYKILPPKTPGKIVIANITSKRKALDDDVNKQKKKTSKKSILNTINKSEVASDSTDSIKLPITRKLSENELQEQDNNFFTYVDLDPMLKPSYVLPTTNIAQNSTNTTPNPPNKSNSLSSSKLKVDLKYTCAICDLEFSREKKLIAHTRGHYEGFDIDGAWDEPACPD